MITCDKCAGDCCKKLAIRIDTPRTKDDFEDIKWYLYHENVVVYIDNEDDWLVQLPVRCKWLGKDNKCKIYNKRPPVCRNAKIEECERNIKETKVLFKTPDNLDDYRKRIKK